MKAQDREDAVEAATEAVLGFARDEQKSNEARGIETAMAEGS